MRLPVSKSLILVAGLSMVTLSCASQNTDGDRLAADSCAANPLNLVSDTNRFTAGPGEVFFADPLQPDGWAERAKERARLAARAAALNSYWQPLADSWGIAEAAARVVEQPEIVETAADLRLSYAMVTKDSYCRIALVRIGTKLSSNQ